MISANVSEAFSIRCHYVYIVFLIVVKFMVVNGAVGGYLLLLDFQTVKSPSGILAILKAPFICGYGCGSYPNLNNSPCG